MKQTPERPSHLAKGHTVATPGLQTLSLASFPLSFPKYGHCLCLSHCTCAPWYGPTRSLEKIKHVYLRSYNEGVWAVKAYVSWEGPRQGTTNHDFTCSARSWLVTPHPLVAGGHKGPDSGCAPSARRAHPRQSMAVSEPGPQSMHISIFLGSTAARQPVPENEMRNL